MILTIFFFFVEIIVGYVTNSMALVADSFHMLGDIAALLISFMSIKVNSISHEESEWNFISTHFSLFQSDVTKKMVQKHIRMGPSWSIRCIS